MSTDSLECYTISLLRRGELFLLLQRGDFKRLFPGRWSGLGGKVEADEFDRLRAAALREVEEEAGIRAEEIQNYCLRRTLLVSRPRQPLRLLFYFTGTVERVEAPACTEGTLYWKSMAEFDALDIIETTRPALLDLAADMQRDPRGEELPRIGTAAFDLRGEFQGIAWG